MDSPEEMSKKVEQYAFYMTLGLLALFMFCVIILVLRFLIGLLVLISMGA